MKLINDIVKLYKNEPINIALKSKNFATLIFVLSIVCLVLFPICLIAKKISVLPIIFIILAFCFVSYFILKKKKYRLATAFFFALICLLPLLLAFSQSSLGYRDVYLYFFFCAPFFVLSAIASYKKSQIILVGLSQIILGYVYTFVKVTKIPGAEMSNIVFCLIIGTAFHIMTTSFLLINLKLEERIISTLKDGKIQMVHGFVLKYGQH
jgi:hypothetical protein